jgi:hypothetical protein
MFDVAILLENKPGEMARMGEALGAAGVSVEGGGGWVVDGSGYMHFLFDDGEAARQALENVGIKVLGVREVLVQKLRQDVPGQLGKIARRIADAGVNIDRSSTVIMPTSFVSSLMTSQKERPFRTLGRLRCGRSARISRFIQISRRRY